MEQITKATKAIVLARVSDEKQDSEEAQVNRLENYVKRFLSVEEIRIKESSTKADRKKFQEVINKIKASKEPVALVADTIDRVQRSFQESVILDELRKEGKVELHF